MTNAPLPDLSYSFSVRVQGRVYCPGCGEHITQRTFGVSRNVVMCIRCAERPLFPDEWLAVALRYYARHSTFVQQRGLLFWQPAEPSDGVVTHYLNRSKVVTDAGFGDT